MPGLDDIKLPLVAILRGITPAEAPAVADALLEGGIEIVEVTVNSPEPLATLAKLVERCGDRMLVGCGTVLDPGTVDRIADAGARLVVSPNFDPEVVHRTKQRGLVSAPGCLTPTEIFAALDAGADIVKVFPGNIATPAVLKAYRAVLPPSTRLLVTGGIDATTIPAYRAAGAYGMGLGSNLYRPGKAPAAVAAAVREFAAAYHAA